MIIKVLGCYGSEMPGFKTTCFRINDSTLLDAGAITSVMTHEEQSKIKDILVTHSHLDHIKDIALLADNAVDTSPHTINVISTKSIVDIIRENLFNGRIWPDFSKIPNAEAPVITYKEIEPEQDFELNGLNISAIEVNHVVPTIGYFIGDKHGTIAFSGDTGSTDKFWEKINSTDNIKGIFIETSFPNSMQELADLSRHLTPAVMADELKKLNRDDIPIYIYHLKPSFLDLIKSEIDSLNDSRISIINMGDTFTF